MKKIYVVGDSTLSSFNDVSYYYPRFGYGTKLDNYFNLEVINLAMSGRSSKSFIKEDNYKFLKDNLSKGDILLIGFGHNDEKYDDPMRFTDARLDYTNEKSFGYYLNEYYIKLAKSVLATPILATPIVRITKGEYKGSIIHDTIYGNYQKYVIELGKILGVEVLDLTSKTLDFVKEIGYNKVIYYHAITNGYKDSNGNILPDPKTVDLTHLNSLGAMYTAYIVANIAKDTNSCLKEFLKSDIKKPTISMLEMNKSFKLREYASPNLMSYNPPKHLDAGSEYYGSAFGECEISPMKENSSYNAYLDKDNTFVVGNKTLYGKINASKDVLSFVFKKIDVSKNFIMKSKIKVEYIDPTSQQAFGMMLRDDCYICQEENDITIATPYIASGICTANDISHINFYRPSSTEIKFFDTSFNGYPNKDILLECEIERLGQTVNIKTIVNGKEYKNSFFDFDLTAVDKDFMYCGFFAVKGVIIRVYDYDFKMLGDAISA